MADPKGTKEAAEKVEAYFDSQILWGEEQRALREILKEFPFSEVIKWRFPTYIYGGKNLVAIAGFKSYFGLWFFEGANLSDPANMLINAQPGKTKMMRQWRMKTAGEIDKSMIKNYLSEVIRLNY